MQDPYMSSIKTTELRHETSHNGYKSNKRKESTDTDYKSTLAEHAATSNHVIDWY